MREWQHKRCPPTPPCIAATYFQCYRKFYGATNAIVLQKILWCYRNFLFYYFMTAQYRFVPIQLFDKSRVGVKARSFGFYQFHGFVGRHVLFAHKIRCQEGGGSTHSSIAVNQYRLARCQNAFNKSIHQGKVFSQIGIF